MKEDKVIARTPSGFPELLPKDQIIFNRMFYKIRSVFELFGYLPIETPAVEFKEVLLAKGGGETEKQVYRLASKSSDTNMCLHFDLTVPLARYVVEHLNDLTFPFRRYQMQKVWRGERAQKGRYREFYQCDIDVIGTTNPLTDAEIPSVIYEIFKSLEIPKFTIGLNNRKFMGAIFKAFSIESSLLSLLSVIDKLGKISIDVARTQLIGLGVMTQNIDPLLKLLSFKGSYKELTRMLDGMVFPNQLTSEGLDELGAVYDGVLSFGVPSDYFQIDLKMVRGLDYYTGTVYETTLDDFPKVGSICSGGRYDNLCQYYTEENLPGVGISIGLSRLFSQLKDAGLLATTETALSKVLIVGLDDLVISQCMKVATQLRVEGINCEVYLEKSKLRKQLRYANDLGIPFVILIGKNTNENKVSLKDLSTGVQTDLSLSEVISIVK